MEPLLQELPLLVTPEQFAKIRSYGQCGPTEEIVPADLLKELEKDELHRFPVGPFRRSGKFPLYDITFYPTQAYSFGLQMLFARSGRVASQKMIHNSPDYMRMEGDLYIFWSDWDEHEGLYGHRGFDRKTFQISLDACVKFRRIIKTDYEGLELSDLVFCQAPAAMKVDGFNNYESGRMISIYARDGVGNTWSFHSDTKSK